MREYQQNQPPADRLEQEHPVFHSFFHSCGKVAPDLSLAMAIM
jgi:hypothetical protein